MKNRNYRWEIKSADGRVIVDIHSHAIALELLSVLQAHALPVTLHLVTEDAQ